MLSSTAESTFDLKRTELCRLHKNFVLMPHCFVSRGGKGGSCFLFMTSCWNDYFFLSIGGCCTHAFLNVSFCFNTYIFIHYCRLITKPAFFPPFFFFFLQNPINEFVTSLCVLMLWLVCDLPFIDETFLNKKNRCGYAFKRMHLSTVMHSLFPKLHFTKHCKLLHAKICQIFMKKVQMLTVYYTYTTNHVTRQLPWKHNTILTKTKLYWKIFFI